MSLFRHMLFSVTLSRNQIYIASSVLIHMGRLVNSSTFFLLIFKSIYIFQNKSLMEIIFHYTNLPLNFGVILPVKTASRYSNIYTCFILPCQVGSSHLEIFVWLASIYYHFLWRIFRPSFLLISITFSNACCRVLSVSVTNTLLSAYHILITLWSVIMNLGRIFNSRIIAALGDPVIRSTFAILHFLFLTIY